MYILNMNHQTGTYPPRIPPDYMSPEFFKGKSFLTFLQRLETHKPYAEMCDRFYIHEYNARNPDEWPNWISIEGSTYDIAFSFQTFHRMCEDCMLKANVVGNSIVYRDAVFLSFYFIILNFLNGYWLTERGKDPIHKCKVDDEKEWYNVTLNHSCCYDHLINFTERYDSDPNYFHILGNFTVKRLNIYGIDKFSETFGLFKYHTYKKSRYN